MIVGWSISNRASAALVIDALEMAQRNGHLELDAIFHSDRGCQPEFNRSSQHCQLRTCMVALRPVVLGCASAIAEAA